MFQLSNRREGDPPDFKGFNKLENACTHDEWPYRQQYRTAPSPPLLVLSYINSSNRTTHPATYPSAIQFQPQFEYNPFSYIHIEKMSISILSLSLSLVRPFHPFFFLPKCSCAGTKRKKKKKLLLALVRLIFQVSLYSLVLIEWEANQAWPLSPLVLLPSYSLRERLLELFEPLTERKKSGLVNVHRKCGLINKHFYWLEL